MTSQHTNAIVEGRPDFENHKFGVTRAKRHPKYVYGNAQGLLMHEIAYVEFRWYEVGPGGHSLIRLAHPKISVTTRCGQVFFYRCQNGKPKSTMCEMPNPGAVLCGRCQGKGPVFGKNGSGGVTKSAAKVRLGCIDVVQLD
jgi:hypothetical protein